MPFRLFGSLCAGLLACWLWAAGGGPATRFDAWRIIGPGGAGGMFIPTLSPHDPNTVLERCDMTGAYISRDGGDSWRMFNLRSPVSAFAFDPQEARVIYAGNVALWRSADSGKTWSMIFPDPKKRTIERMPDDHAAPVLVTGDAAYSRGRAAFIAVDPWDNRRIYAAFADARRSWLVFSADRGASWTRMREFPGERIHLIYFDAGVRVVGESGVYTRQGVEWRHLAPPDGERIQFASGGSGLLYVTSESGMHISEDGGQTWRLVKNALPGAPRYLAVACSAQHPRTAYVAYAKLREYFGIAKTTDAGEHWSVVYQESHQRAPNVERAWIEDFYGGTGPVRDIGVAPSNPDICFVTDSCPRSFRTVDGGKTWRQVISEHVAGDRWTTTGFDVTTCYGVHFDPFDLRNMFITYTDVGLFKSSDGGESWHSSIGGIPRRWQNTTYWVAFDPKVKGLMWGAFARTHDLPRAKMWERMDPDAFGGGVGISTDGGDHWTVSNTGMPETAVTHILLDPASPVGHRTLYACGFGRGVFKSVDNGKTWALKIDGIEKRQPFTWRITRADDGTLYVVVVRRSDASYKSDAEDGALYRSTDGAEHWVKMKLPAGVNGPNGLTLDPEDNRRLYLSAWGAATPSGVTGGGVFLSTDAGETWKNIFQESQHVYDVTADPKNPKVLYNAGFETGAYRSLDGGATWTRVRGFNFKWGHRVILDPVDPGKIYITTFGGSVWHGPAAGDPNAVEDIVTPIPVAR